MQVTTQWSRVRFDRMAEHVRETVQPSAAAGMPYIALEHIGEGTLHLIGVGKAEDATSTKSRFRRGDILFGKLRPYFRKVVRAPFEGVCSTDIWVVSPRSGVDPGYLFYLMASDLFVEPVVRASEGTKMPRAKWDYAAALELPLPPLPEQRAIAHILGTLDDKIELNRRMARTLEEMARALFKAWFVDFEPVRAKMDGRWRRGESLPGLPAHVYDLFPDRLVDSELGPIPEGWEVGTLGEVARHIKRHAKPDEITASTPYIALEHMPRCSLRLAQWSTAAEVMSNKFRFRRGEILFGKLRPYFYKIGVAPVDGVCSTDILVLNSISPAWFGFVLGHISGKEFVDYASARSTGTKMPRVRWSDVADYKVALPPESAAEALTSLLSPLIDSLILGIEHSRTTAAVRDTLLPRVVSGTIRVNATVGCVPEDEQSC